MANWVAHCVSIIFLGLWYRFSSCRGGDKDINHDCIGDPWLKCWNEYWSSPWRGNVLVSSSISHIQNRQKIHIDMFIISKICVMQSWIANPHDPLIRDPLIHDPLNTGAHTHHTSPTFITEGHHLVTYVKPF